MFVNRAADIRHLRWQSLRHQELGGVDNVMSTMDLLIYCLKVMTEDTRKSTPVNDLQAKDMLRRPESLYVYIVYCRVSIEQFRRPRLWEKGIGVDLAYVAATSEDTLKPQ